MKKFDKAIRLYVMEISNSSPSVVKWVKESASLEQLLEITFNASKYKATPQVLENSITKLMSELIGVVNEQWYKLPKGNSGPRSGQNLDDIHEQEGEDPQQQQVDPAITGQPPAPMDPSMGGMPPQDPSMGGMGGMDMGMGGMGMGGGVPTRDPNAPSEMKDLLDLDTKDQETDAERDKIEGIFDIDNEIKPEAPLQVSKPKMECIEEKSFYDLGIYPTIKILSNHIYNQSVGNHLNESVDQRSADRVKANALRNSLKFVTALESVFKNEDMNKYLKENKQSLIEDIEAVKVTGSCDLDSSSYRFLKESILKKKKKKIIEENEEPDHTGDTKDFNSLMA